MDEERVSTKEGRGGVSLFPLKWKEGGRNIVAKLAESPCKLLCAPYILIALSFQLHRLVCLFLMVRGAVLKTIKGQLPPRRAAAAARIQYKIQNI